MASLKDLLNKTAVVETEFDGEAIKLRYAVHKYSTEFHNKLTQVTDGAESACVILNELLLDWNFTDGEGNKVPISLDLLRTLPLTLLFHLSKAIMDAISDAKNGES